MMTDAWGALDAEAAQALLRGLPTPMLLVDAAGIVVAANDGAADLLGLRCADLVGAPLGPIFPAFEAEGSWSRWFDELAVVPLDSIHGVRHAAGIRTAEVLARRSGSRVVLLLRDVTEERALNYQSARRISEATRVTGFLTRVLRHFPLVLYVVDGAGVFRLAEGLGFTQFDDVDVSRVVGRSIHEIYKDLPEVVATFHRALQGQLTNFRTEFRGRTFENFVVPLPLEEPESGIVAVALDVTDAVVAQREADAVRSKLEKELVATNADLSHALKLRDEFLAATSHELRTPLHAILGLVESVLEGAFGSVDASVERPLRAILDAARQQLGHINGILDLTKLEGGAAELRCELIGAARLAVDAVEFSKSKAERAQVDLTLATGSDRTIDVDRKRITRALLELIDNAIKFTPPRGSVHVSAEPVGESFVFEVTDSGVGVDERDRARIFHPFVQADGRLSRAKNGLGLGLALVDRIVALHGGKLEFTSTVGEGSSFRIVVPAVAAAVAVAGAPSLRARSAESALAGLRVVFVASTRAFDAHRDLLEIKGAEAHVLSVSDALVRLEAAPIDVLVIGDDVALEDLARLVVTVRTHGYGSRVAVLALGARPEPSVAEGWSSAGVEAWLDPRTDLRMFLQIVAREHRRRAILAPLAT